MKKILILIAGAALLLSCQTSKRISYLNIPDERGSRFETVNVDSLLEKYAGHDGVYLNVERTIEHSGGKGASFGQVLFGPAAGVNWNFCDIEVARYMVINPEAAYLTHMEFYAKPDELYMIVSNPDGSVRRYGLNDLREEKEGDRKIYRFIYPDVQRGTIIETGHEYAYSVGGWLPPLDYDILCQYHVPVEKLSFSFAYPNWWTIKIKDSGPYSKVVCDYREEIEERKTIMSYSATDIPAILQEPYCPYFKEVCKHIHFKVITLAMGGGDIDRTLTWNDIAETAWENVVKPAEKGQKEIASFAQEITTGCKSDYEKLDRIVTYIQDSIEISSGFGKADYRKAIKTKKCGYFASVGLARAALVELGIPARLILVHSANDGYWDEGYVDYGEFAVAALRVDIGPDPYVCFPYIENLPLDHTPPRFQGQPALVVLDDGIADFWTLPPGNRASNTTDEDYKITLGEDGLVTIDETDTFEGYEAYNMREWLSDMTEDKREEAIKKVLNRSGVDLNLLSHEIQNLDHRRKPLVIKLKYEIANVLTITPEEAIFHSADLFRPISGIQSSFDPNFRQLPIVIHYDERRSKNIEINFPPSWQVKSGIEDVSTENVLGSISGTCIIDGGRLTLNQAISLNRANEPREAYPQLLELLGDPSLLKVSDVIFTISPT